MTQRAAFSKSKGVSTRRPTKRRQTGAALLTAMLTVTLVATLASAALWQQFRSFEVEAAERGRLQSGLILTGALDWARLILREDARSGGADHLAEPWAVPLQEARMSSFLAADKNNTALSPEEENTEVFLSGQITDAQSLLNVTNLVDNGKVHEPTFKAFAKLFDLLNLEQNELLQLAENLRFAGDIRPENQSAQAQFAPLMPQRIDQLVWLGVSPATLQKLTPYISLLPVRAALNVNTAPAELLYASIPALQIDGARRMVTKRAQQHFRNLGEAGQVVPEIAAQISEGQHSVATRFFEVRGRLRLNELVVQERSLVQRDGLDVRTLWRERSALSPQLGSDDSGAGPAASLQ